MWNGMALALRFLATVLYRNMKGMTKQIMNEREKNNNFNIKTVNCD